MAQQANSLMNDEQLHVFKWVFLAVGTEVIDIAGTITNVINIVCFLKRGFKDIVNISLFGLAISDLGCLVPLIWANICYNPSFNNLDLPFEPIEVQYLTAAWIHVIFTRVTSWITAFITLERCLCITMPLKVKIIFTHKRVIAIIISIFVVLIANVLPVYYVNRIAWKFSSIRNKTLVGLVFTADRETVEGVLFPVNVILPFSAFLIICVCTLTLVIQLRGKSKWRNATCTSGQAEQPSNRDQKVTKMVIVISTLFIACFTPVCLIAITMILEPQFSIEGRHKNLFITFCNVGFTMESINSASNIFIYYHMSSKFRVVCRQLFLRRKRGREHWQD